MATITMGLRRRVQVGSSSSVAQPSGSKRSRSENNNSPSQGNLNSPGSEPAPKKSRGPSSSAGARTAKAKELELAKKTSMNNPGPPHWSDPRPYASIAGLSLQAQAALCPDAVGLPSPMSYMSSQMATFVGTATNLGKSPSVSYLDISNMTARPPGWPTDDAKGPMGLPFAAGSLAGPGPYGTSAPKAQNKESGAQSSCLSLGESQASKPAQVTLPKNFPNDSMFSAYQPWVIKTYGDLAKTKTITIRKYARILRTLRGEEVNSAENSKFRFWVKSKGFHIGQPEGYEPKPADRIIGRHAVTNPGLDPPLYVPTQPPHNKALNGAEGTVPPGRVYKKVAIVENFFDIIHAVHVDLEGRPGKHAGQKRTYRTITETYAFLPREAVTRFLLGCTECQRRPRTPSPTSLAPTPTPNTPTTAAPAPTPTLTTSAPTGTPPSPRPATTLSSGATSARTGAERPREASHAPESESPHTGGQQRPQQPKSTATPSATTATTATTATPSSSASSLPKAPVEASKSKLKDEKYNPLSVTNLLRKDPISRRPPPPPPPPAAAPPAPATLAHLPESENPATSAAGPTSSEGGQRHLRIIPEEHGCRSTPSPLAGLPRPWSPVVEPKCAPIDYSLPIAASFPKQQQQQQQQQQRQQQQRLETAKETRKERTTEGQDEDSSSDSDSENERGFSPAAGLIDTNLNLLATIQQLHCQVMLALTERLRPPGPTTTPTHASGAHDAGPSGES